MGSFIGHVVPGSFFVLFGAWWTFQICCKYLKSITKSGESFKCQTTYPPLFRTCTLDLEAVVALTAAVIGMLIELVFACSFRGSPIGVTNMQHATMYFFFGLLGLLGILTPVLKKMFPNIEELRYIGLAMAFTVEAILFKFHLMGRDMLDVTIHTLLLYSVYGCIIMTFAEVVFRNQVLTSLGRAYFTILQGTWFWQVAFILYNPFTDHKEWNHGNHEHIMLTTCIYTWHVGAVFLFSLGCGIGWACVYRRRGELGDDELTMEPVANGYTHLTNHEDDVEHTTRFESWKPLTSEQEITKILEQQENVLYKAWNVMLWKVFVVSSMGFNSNLLSMKKTMTIFGKLIYACIDAWHEQTLKCTSLSMATPNQSFLKFELSWQICLICLIFLPNCKINCDAKWSSFLVLTWAWLKCWSYHSLSLPSLLGHACIVQVLAITRMGE